jgi:transposase
MMMEGTPLLPLPQGLQITHIEKLETGLMIHVLSTQPTCLCPLCEALSDAVHSRYQRSLKDLPCCGQQIGLQLTVRKFFCQNPQCQRKIFTERLPTFVEPWAQMTLRLGQALQAIGLSTSGSLGARLSLRLGIATSWMTILRHILRLPEALNVTVTVLGVDDFSFKRGRKFGTILVDLSTHQVIDLLPERSSESAGAWMRGHPEIRYVSRDRGKDYATACREGAPQAVAIADRFHVMKNFVEALEPEVTRCYKHLRQMSAPASDEQEKVASREEERKRLERLPDKSERFEQVKAFLSHGLSPQEVADLLALPVRTVYRWQERENCPAYQRQRTEPTERQERYALAQTLRAHGLSYKAIAERLAVGERTVQRWLRQQAAPYSQPRRKRRSPFDPYAAYVLSRGPQGERSVGLIWSAHPAAGLQRLHPGRLSLSAITAPI